VAETGDVTPSRLPPDVRGLALERTGAALDALDVRWRVTHTELRVTQTEVEVIEVNHGRVGGCRASCHTLAHRSLAAFGGQRWGAFLILAPDGAPDRRWRIRVRGAVRAPLVDLHQRWRQFQAAEEASYFISAARRYGLPRAEALVESLLHLGDAFCQDVARRVRQGQVAALGQALSSRSTTISIIRATG
jgi:hypothetical protein